MKDISLKAQISGVVFFTALLIASIVTFVTIFSAPPYKTPPKIDRSYNRDAMEAALKPDAVKARFDEIIALGSRAPGQKGLEATAALIKSEFEKAGLEILTQDVMLPYALTDGGNGTITFADASKQVVYPFSPNYTQPVVTYETDADGNGRNTIEGELFLVTEEAVRKENDLSDKIALVDLDKPLFKDLGLNPAQYINLGFKAVILTHSKGLREISWQSLSTAFRTTKLPFNIVRLAAEPEILSHVGEKVSVNAVSRWQNVKTQNIVGVLRAPNAKTKEALVIPFTYDASSIIPDYAEGPVQALKTATVLQLLQGILPHKDALQRDIIFVAATGTSQALNGMDRIITTVGNAVHSSAMLNRINDEDAANENYIKMLEEISKAFEDPAFAVAGEVAVAERIVNGFTSDTKKYFSSRFSALTRRTVFAKSEELLRAEIAFNRNPSEQDEESKALAIAFRSVKKNYDELNNFSALPLARAVDRPVAAKKVFTNEDGENVSLREALEGYISSLKAYHEGRREYYAKEKKLCEFFRNYTSLVGFTPQLQPAAKVAEGAAEDIAYVSGYFAQGTGNTCEAANLFGQLINDSIYELGLEKQVKVTRPANNTSFNAQCGGIAFDTNPWGVVSIPAFTILSPKNSVLFFEHPFVQPAFSNLNSIASSLRVAGEVAISLGRGYGVFGRLPFSATYSFKGSVYAAGVGNSVVPNYEVANALVASPDDKPMIFTDCYGAYDYPLLTMPHDGNRRQPLEAFYFGKNGLIEYVKDYGISAQSIYKSLTMPTTPTPVNLVLYRAAPVAVLDIVNPQTMKAFSSVQFISSVGLSEFASTCPYNESTVMMNFLPPKEYFFLTLKAGAPGNELVAETRAFCLGVLNNETDKHYRPTGNEIDGAGYLAYDTPIVHNIACEASASMAFLDKGRLDLQKRYGMADDMTIDIDDNANKIIDDLQNASNESEGGKKSLLERLHEYRKAFSLYIINHPVIRNSVSEAVLGILWYMGLLVPFVFFFEKLVFGFTDIRKQIIAEAIIFLIVFSLLRILHPAFHMIRSSVMILLGFVIIIIVASVTSMLSTKFQENLDAMRASNGVVKGAKGNTFGIVLTAFMLGLNNMHRRKVRTGLTCATLVLMTFVMICFTSVQSNVQEKEREIGVAKYQGILVREKQFMNIDENEVIALNKSYGEKYTVNVRQGIVGSVNAFNMTKTIPDFKVTHGVGERALTRDAKGGLGFTHTEPLADSITMLTTNGWFTAEQAALQSAPYPIMLPDELADRLAITPEMVNAGKVDVNVNGVDFFVWGIFKSSELANVVDVDGENLIPFDVEALATPQVATGYVLAEPTDTRLLPSEILIGLNGQLPVATALDKRNLSVVIDMGSEEKTPETVARAEIKSYLTQTGRDCNYGLAGKAYNGRYARVRTMAGMADLIIPLIIAALTVLNTMKGSVYERKTEIFVYNAVGIAPRYIFFMFVAEALVYSIVGAVLGYILSQGTGRILTMLDLTGGMNMNFTSVTTIYASLAIAAATLASTYFPARSAIEIAKPTDDAGWSLPPPDDDDSITFSLPFTFTHYDRIAVLSFFYKYFENLGEGSSGAFFSGQPKLTISDETDPLANGAYIPRLEVQVWLKPFDLGVSQMIIIDLPTDPDTGEYISKMRLVRLTGTRDAWVRLNKPMVALIRQHFLHWRAVPKATKTEYFAEAKALLEETVKES